MSPNLYHLAGLLAPGSDRSPGRVACDLASAGVPVFPGVPGQKRPLTTRGFHDVTTDLTQIEEWWARWPEANLGLPTGAASGVVVVDVDVREHVDGRESMRRALDAGRAGVPVFTVVSPSGGRHAYYPATPDVVQRSWQASRAGVDFRGDGGYIVIPPHTRPLARIGWPQFGKGRRPGSTATYSGSSSTLELPCSRALLIGAWLRPSRGWCVAAGCVGCGFG